MDRTHQTSAVSHVPVGSGSETEPLALFFAGLRLEADGTLYRGEAPLHLPPRELAALRLLLANAGQIVTAVQLKQALWGEVHVTADSVPRLLSSLRAHLHPDNCIQTVYKRGYRLFAGVRSGDSETVPVLPRLAIPPFTIETGVPVHLGTAIAEETIARLSNAQKPLASVLARDSVFTLAQRGMTAQQIGESLHADMVLAGTLRAFTTHFRLRMEMVRVADGVQIWVEDLLVDRQKIAGIESDLAGRIDFRLKSRPIGSRPRSAQNPQPAKTSSDKASQAGALKDVSTSDSSSESEDHLFSIAASAQSAQVTASTLNGREAFETFLRGRHEWQTMERHRMQDGLQQLVRAAELDPSLIDAKVELVNLCVTQAFMGFMSPAIAANLVRRTAESIPDFPAQAESVLPALAWVNLHFDRNLAAALCAYELSTHLPHDAWTTRVRAMFALSRQRPADAIALLRGVLELDPFSPWLHARLAWALHLDGQTAESVEQIERTILQFPEHEAARVYGSMILAFNGETQRAVQLAEGIAQRQPSFDLAGAVHANALAAAGRPVEARAILDRLQWLSRERFVLKSFTPAAYVALGDIDTALFELNAANEDRCPWLFQMIADPRLNPLHGHPEFEKIRAILPGMEAEVESGVPIYPTLFAAS